MILVGQKVKKISTNKNSKNCLKTPLASNFVNLHMYRVVFAFVIKWAITYITHRFSLVHAYQNNSKLLCFFGCSKINTISFMSS